jgi:TATA-box binding protein (TBP) (component of TFIID and TFIIIB)
MDDALQQIEARRHACPLKLNSLRVCTMTVNIRTDGPESDIDEGTVRHIFGETAEINTAKSFNNCKTIRFREDGKKRAIKVFCNGSFHVTGYSKLEDSIEAVRKIIDPPKTISTVNIQMMNTLIKSEYHFQLRELYDAFKHDGTITVNYDPERHAGLHVKVVCPKTERKVTIIIFRTGSVLITGVQNAEELLCGYFKFESLMTAYLRYAITPTPEEDRPVKRKRKFDYAEYL